MKKRIAFVLLGICYVLTACQEKKTLDAENALHETESTQESEGFESEATEALALPETIMTVKNGSEIKVDLDGDGLDEEISYDVDYNDSSYEATPHLMIDDIDCSAFLQCKDAWISDGYLDYFCILDIDTSDTYKEIGILDNGPSDDPVTYVFRYENGSFYQSGSFSDLATSESCTIAGDGSVLASMRINLLETASTKATWKLDDQGYLKFADQEWYDINDIDWNTGNAAAHQILQSVKVYQSNDLTAEQVEITEGDGPVSFQATDNLNWVRIENGNGVEWYLYMKDFSTIVSGDTEVYASEVFSDIWLAD